MILVMVVLSALILHLREAPDRSRDMESQLPIYKVENGYLLSKQGDVTVAYRLRLPEIFTLSNEDYEALHHIWVKAIKILPPATVLHKQDWFTEDKFQADFSQDKDFLSAASDRFFHERPFLAHECYLMITKKATGRKPASSVFSNLLRKSFLPPETINPQAMLDFQDKLGQFEKLLSDAGFITIDRLQESELTGTDLHAGILEKYLFLLQQGEIPVVKDIIFKPQWSIGEKFCQLYSMGDIDDLPSLCGSRITYDRYSTDKTKFSVSFAAPVGGLLNCNHIYNQFIFIEDTQKTLKQFESKRRRLQSMSAYSRENAISRDAVNAFLNEAITEQRLPVKAHFNLLTWTDKLDDLKNIRNITSAALATMDATPRQEIKGAPQIFWAGLPGNEADFPLNDTFSTFAEQATCFFNQETNYRTSLSPVGVRLTDRLSGKPVWVDLSDELMQLGIITNRNKFILGPSGSGKSFLTNHLVRSYYETGSHIVLVDVGHSYRGLCTLVGGYYFTYEEKNPIRFNPFFVSAGDILDTEKKESLKALLLALWKRDDEVFKRSEYVALSNALAAYFAYLDLRPEVFPCFNSFYEFFRDHYLDQLKADNVKERDFDADNFMYVLRPFYAGGEFDYLLNATENLDLLDQRMIVFELDNLKDHAILFPVVTLMVMEIFISKMRKLKGVRKIILIEEAWKALMKAGFAEYIKYLFKTVRKFFGEAWVVTQDVEDIVSSSIVKQAIINNSDVKILLDQSKHVNKFGMLQELLSLTEKQKSEILSMNKGKTGDRIYKDGWFGMGSTHSKVFGVEVSREEYYCYTTEEKEKVMVQQYAAKFGDMAKGIRALIHDLAEQKRLALLGSPID